MNLIHSKRLTPNAFEIERLRVAGRIGRASGVSIAHTSQTSSQLNNQFTIMGMHLVAQ